MPWLYPRRGPIIVGGPIAVLVGIAGRPMTWAATLLAGAACYALTYAGLSRPTACWSTASPSARPN